MNLSPYTYIHQLQLKPNHTHAKEETKQMNMYRKKMIIETFFHSLLQSAGTFGRLATRKTFRKTLIRIHKDKKQQQFTRLK